MGSRVLLALIFVWTLWSTRTSSRDAAGNWDVAHFLRIARDGYAVTNEAAFFPGLPLLLRAAGAVGRSCRPGHDRRRHRHLRDRFGVRGLGGVATRRTSGPVSYTHLRAHETRHDLVCR